MDHVNDDATSSAVIHGSQIIHPKIYEAAADGNIEPFKGSNNDLLEVLATPIKNTILHICIASPKRTHKASMFVEQILQICPSLLMKVNDRGDTPLHLAAKLGHFAIVEVLIKVANAPPQDSEIGLGDAKLRMLRMKNNLGNTALHEAVKNCYPEVVELLTEEDPDFSYSANDSGESPLFIATEVVSPPMVTIILENCRLASHEGPDGKTALHVAVQSNNLDITTAILEKKSDLTKATDNNGWTPLHYAAYYGHDSIVQHLLQHDGDAAFVADKVRQMTPLHSAAGQGYVKIMEEIILCRPDCCEMVDVNGWNFLHFALAACSHHIELLVFFLRSSKFQKLVRNLLTAKDIEGNNPLHVYAVCKPHFFVAFFSQMKDKVCQEALNKENDSILVTHRYGSAKLQNEIDQLKVFGNGPYRKGIIRSRDLRTSNFFQRMEKGKDAQLVVAALVATVTFTAGLTVPGGFDQVKGTSLLTKRAAFQAFIITDAIAFTLSLLAVFIHFLIALNVTEKGYMFNGAFYSTELAIVAMAICFATGTYAVLKPPLGLAVATNCIGLSFFVLLLTVIVKFVRHQSFKTKRLS